ncbi:MAG: PilZ domain-containing protein [Proteobacteria bacterium]|nr:PilZ domain-containing protein [Pseudomonadota bacterium]
MDVETMGDNDHRHISRDSMFVQARLRDAAGAEHMVRIRNLSSGGVMAEGNLRMQRGDAISIEIRNVGWVDGNVAWVADSRFGIAFCESVDPRAVRSPVIQTGPKPVSPHDLLLHRPMAVRLNPVDPRQPVVRKI